MRDQGLASNQVQELRNFFVPGMRERVLSWAGSASV